VWDGSYELVDLVVRSVLLEYNVDGRSTPHLTLNFPMTLTQTRPARQNENPKCHIDISPIIPRDDPVFAPRTVQGFVKTYKTVQ
jgi:hypothetical protein